MPDYDQELDACGLNCPLPILRAKKTLSKMDSGEVLRIVAIGGWDANLDLPRRDRVSHFKFSASEASVDSLGDPHRPSVRRLGENQANTSVFSRDAAAQDRSFTKICLSGNI